MPSLSSKCYTEEQRKGHYIAEDDLEMEALYMPFPFAGCKAAAARLLQKLALTPAAADVYSILHPGLFADCQCNKPSVY